MSRQAELDRLYTSIHALQYNARIAAEEGDEEAVEEMLEKAEQKKQRYRDLQQNEDLQGLAEKSGAEEE